jgi:hypothetical protein
MLTTLPMPLAFTLVAISFLLGCDPRVFGKMEGATAR